MEYKNVKGIVVKETKYKENDKILTIVTDALGKINVVAKGVSKPTSKLNALSTLALIEMDLKQTGENMYISTGASKVIDFYAISKDL